MARTRQISVYSAKTGKMWAKTWSKISKKGKTINFLREALIRYPKTPTLIKEIALTLSNLDFDQETDLLLLKRILFKYKRLFPPYLDYASMERTGFEEIPRFLQFLKSHFEEISELGYPGRAEGINLQGKRVKIAETCSDTNRTGPRILFSNLLKFRKYVELRHLLVDSLPSFDLLTYKRILFASKNHLQHLALQGPLEKSLQSKDLIDIINLSLTLPNLKSYRFDVTCPQGFSVDKFPFDFLQKRRINFDIRLTHDASTSLSEESLACLSDLEYLGVNNIQEFVFLNKTDFEFEVQKELSRLLFLNISSQDFNFNALLQACQKLSTLHLGLNSEHQEEIDFSCLRRLSNLKNLILRLEGQNVQAFQPLFDDLTVQAKSHQSLQSLVFKLNLQSWNVNLSPFIEACTETLQEVQLQIFNPRRFVSELPKFYESFNKIQNLTSLSIEFIQWRPLRISDYEDGDLYFTKDFIKFLQNFSRLMKLRIVLYCSVIFKSEAQEIAFQLPESIKEFQLDLDFDLSIFAIDKLLNKAIKLERLILNTKFTPTSEEQLLKSLGRLQELETLVVGAKTEELFKYKILQTVMPKLKCLSLSDMHFIKKNGCLERIK